MTASAVPPQSNYLDLHHRVMEAYAMQGFSRALVGGWAISDNDVEDFVALAVEANPKHILEVGTFVGVSTMLLALACPEARIVTVDPDLPLSVEMGAVDEGAAEAQGITAQSVAKRAAELLGVCDRIEFVKGGFAVADTFSSTLHADGEATEIVGPSLCNADHPFDFIFIDGLHTVDAVAADLALAEKALTDDGVIVLHDCIGFWGAQVRAGVFEFLRRRPQYRFWHPRYDALYRSVGVIRKNAAAAHGRTKRAQDPAITETLLEAARTAIGPQAVVEIKTGASRSPRLKSRVCSTQNVEEIAPSLEAAAASGCGGFFSSEIADFADDRRLCAVLSAVAKTRLPLVLATTPPGEIGVAGPESRPIARIIDLAGEAGLRAFAPPALDLEPARFALLPQPRQLGLSSLFSSLIVLFAGHNFTDARDRPYPMITAALAAEAEQLQLQRVHITASFRHYLVSYNKRGETIANEVALRISATEDFERRTRIYQSDLEEIRAAAADLTAQLQNFGSANAALSEKSARLQEANTTLNEEVGRLGSVNNEQAAEIARLREASAALTEKSARLQEANTTLNEEVGRLGSVNNEQAAEIVRLREASAALTDEVTRLKHGNAMLKDDLHMQKEFADHMLSRLVSAYQAVSVVDHEIDRQSDLINLIRGKISMVT